ncbi:MAG: DUF1501 domain-containing protein [Planctomycetota bacterium]
MFESCCCGPHAGEFVGRFIHALGRSWTCLVESRGDRSVSQSTVRTFGDSVSWPQPCSLIVSQADAAPVCCEARCRSRDVTSAPRKNFTSDPHATLLALMRLDHEQITYHYGGRNFGLTDVEGNVVKEIFA